MYSYIFFSIYFSKGPSLDGLGCMELVVKNKSSHFLTTLYLWVLRSFIFQSADFNLRRIKTQNHESLTDLSS
jgi:hypothetical protein